jgi:pyruvate carboxylase
MEMKPKTFEQVVNELRGQRILVANRGIPARRVARTIREQFDAVAVVTATDVDRTAPYTASADEIMQLGDNPRAYLDIQRIVDLAAARGIVAIHPGWGFASEDARFPALCRKAGLVFVGPPSEAMELLGNKVQARHLARKLGIPIVPGSDGAVDIPQARQLADEMGFPIMLKAEGGGGGRGIYRVLAADQLTDAFEKASTLAQSAFGNPRLFVERLLTSVRHIEIQVVADQFGNVLALDERDCTVQRNHQKLVEITPSPWPGLTPALRARLKDYAERLVKEAGYHSLATVEFLVDDEGNPYFIEANTRLQVEHGITEVRYGIDLVEEQIAIAFGAKLRLNRRTARPSQVAMQVRINCEDPQNEFAPSCGRITRYIPTSGPGVRLDSCISADYEFPPDYDSAAVLLITYGQSWTKVLAIMERALSEYVIDGVKTTIPFHREIIGHPEFQAGRVTTNFISDTPHLKRYRAVEPEPLRLARLIAEISARGHNPYVQLEVYRGRADKRVGPFEPVLPPLGEPAGPPPYPRGDRDALLAQVREAGVVHFMDTTGRDMTQSNSGNRFRLAEDELIGPYLDRCRFFSLENGGGAHFHMAMLANQTYPFSEAAAWNHFAPRTPKQVLVRSTNLLGYRPEPRNVMRLTAEMICEHYDVVRCFDFLNDIENMAPLAEVVLASKRNVFEPAISMSWAPGFDVPHYLAVAEAIVNQVARIAGVSARRAEERFILGLKDMAGVCPPRFMRELIGALRARYPGLILHYHRHVTDGLFIAAVGAAAAAGAHIVDTGIGSSVRWYGQGDVLATVAYLEEELGLKTALDLDRIRDCDFLLKQIMPFFDRYAAPYFQGVDHDVVRHGMPGGASSSSQEGAMKQGYIRLLPYMLRFLAGTRQIVRYHDVTPGSQITWNVAFLAVTAAFKRGGEPEVQHLLRVLDAAVKTPEAEVGETLRQERLMLYRESNDPFRDMLRGKFGRMPLGFPPDWVYESAFGAKARQALAERTTEPALAGLADADLAAERRALAVRLDREPTAEEFVMYLNHPGDALKTIQFREKFGDPNRLPLDVWFEGLTPGRELLFNDSRGKPHAMTITRIPEPDENGVIHVGCLLDSEALEYPVKVAEPAGGRKASLEMADRADPHHLGAPTSGDLWAMYVAPGDLVSKGQELFNITVMKQEKAVLAPLDAVVKRVLKHANYKKDRKMVPVREGELLVELGPVPRRCGACQAPVRDNPSRFCPECGAQLDGAQP